MRNQCDIIAENCSLASSTEVKRRISAAAAEWPSAEVKRRISAAAEEWWPLRPCSSTAAMRTRMSLTHFNQPCWAPSPRCPASKEVCGNPEFPHSDTNGEGFASTATKTCDLHSDAPRYAPEQQVGPSHPNPVRRGCAEGSRERCGSRDGGGTHTASRAASRVTNRAANDVGLACHLAASPASPLAGTTTTAPVVRGVATATAAVSAADAARQGSWCDIAAHTTTSTLFGGNPLQVARQLRLSRCPAPYSEAAEPWAALGIVPSLAASATAPAVAPEASAFAAPVAAPSPVESTTPAAGVATTAVTVAATAAHGHATTIETPSAVTVLLGAGTETLARGPSGRSQSATSNRMRYNSASAGDCLGARMSVTPTASGSHLGSPARFPPRGAAAAAVDPSGDRGFRRLPHSDSGGGYRGGGNYAGNVRRQRCQSQDLRALAGFQEQPRLHHRSKCSGTAIASTSFAATSAAGGVASVAHGGSICRKS